MTSGRPDSDLIAGSRAEPAMFSEIFDRHHRELYRYLRSRVGAELAADLAAETFVTVSLAVTYGRSLAVSDRRPLAECEQILGCSASPIGPEGMPEPLGRAEAG